VRTEYLTLGVVSLVHVLRANPGRLVPYVAMLPSVAFLFHEWLPQGQLRRHTFTRAAA